MSEPLARSPRQVAIADHLWETLGLISRDMGVDRDGLVNQALFAFARQHGYLAPAVQGRPTAEAPVAATPMAPTAVAAPVSATPAAPAAPVVAPAPVAEPEVQLEQPVGVAAPEPPPAAAPSAPPPAPAKSPFVSSTPSLDPVVFEDPLPPLNAPMPGMASNPGAAAAEPAFSAPSGLTLSEPPVKVEAPAGASVLVLYAEGRAVDRVTAPRFLIGRGKHCDLIINSGKVSREHAAIVREGESYFIEDLGSSNGTWYDKKRITRRQIDNGDEYFVCSEKITCRFE